MRSSRRVRLSVIRSVPLARLATAYRKFLHGGNSDCFVKGAKIRSTYVKWALGEKKRLEEELEQKKRQVRGKETEVEQARRKWDCLIVPTFGRSDWSSESGTH